MNSPAPAAPVISPRNGWQTLKGLALITPVLAVIWMAFISKLDHPTLSWSAPHFRAFWLWDAIGLATVTWVIGLVARLLRPAGEAATVRKGVLAMVLVGATLVGVYAGLYKISQFIVMSAVPLVVAVGFYVGSWPMAAQKRAAQQLTIMVSAFFAAAVWMGLRFEGQSAIGAVARTWLALGCAAGIWLALRSPEMQRPELHLGQEVIAGYLFAAGVSLAPGIWGGEVRQLFAGDQTLFLAMVVGVNRWIRRFAALPAGAEHKLLSKLIPLTLCAALAMLYPLWHHLLPESNLTDRRMCLVLGISLAGMLATCGFLKRLSPTQLDMTLSLCLASPVILLLWPNAWV